MWDVQNNFNLLCRIETEPRRPLKGLVWDPLGQFLAAQSNDGTLYVWRLQDWKLETLISSPYTGGPVESLTYFSRPAWSPDGRVLCLPDALNESDTVALLVERDDWRCEQSLVGHAGAVQTARFSPRLYRTTGENQLVVALGAQDGVISLWSSDGERPLAVLTGLFDHAVMDLAWSADGRCLYAASYDGTIAIIKMEPSVVGTVVSVGEQDDLLGKLCQVQNSAVLALPTSLAQIALQDRLDSIMAHRKPANSECIRGIAESKNPISTTESKNPMDIAESKNLTTTAESKNRSDSPAALQAGLVTTPIPIDAIASVPVLETPQRESRLKNGKRRITPQLLQSTNPTPSTESYTVVVGKAARKNWLRVTTPKTLVIGTIEVSNNTSSGNSCRIVKLQNSSVLWEERYDSLVTAAVVTETDVLIAALNTNRIVVLSPAGRRLLPPLLLSAPVTRLVSCENVCIALLDNGLFYVWY
jgi:WD40 repeat protein